jgi:hypothetical protein
MMTKQKKCAEEEGTINEGKMTSIAESEMEALPPKKNHRNRIQTRQGRQKRGNSEDLKGSSNRRSLKFPKPGNHAMDADNPHPNLIQLEEKF